MSLMRKRYFMGIDVAKATFDFCLFSSNMMNLVMFKFLKNGISPFPPLDGLPQTLERSPYGGAAYAGLRP